jgi:DNA repair exonuclease SbcCD ATPase subunit
LEWPDSMSIMAEEIRTEEERQQAELRSLIAGLSQHLDDLYTELEGCENEIKQLRDENEDYKELRKAHENLRARKEHGRFRRFRNWCRSRGRRILGR